MLLAAVAERRLLGAKREVVYIESPSSPVQL